MVSFLEWRRVYKINKRGYLPTLINYKLYIYPGMTVLCFRAFSTHYH